MTSLWHTLGRLALDGTAFLAGLLAGCAAIGAMLPFPEIPQITAKLAFFRQHAAEYDTLFLGSSRVYHQLLPSLFDQVTAEQGMATKSFNAAIDGMRPPELNYYLEQLLEAGPKNLRWVFLENGAVRVALDADKRDTLRSVYWHDFTRMRLVTRVALANRKPPNKPRFRNVLESYQQPLSDVAEHAQLFVRNFTNLGRANILTDALTKQPPRPVGLPADLGPEGDGYRVTRREETILPENLKILEAALATRRAKPFTVDYADPESQREHERVLKTFEDRGAATVQLIPPTTGSRKFHLRSEKERPRLVLDYSDFVQYAALYETRFRIDTDHLNHAGAQYFTRLVAEEFCAKARVRP